MSGARIPEGMWLDEATNTVRPERHDTCRRGHSPALPSRAACPSCGFQTAVWVCQEHCDGMVIADNHECRPTVATT